MTAIATLVGSIIGAGILGIPYAVAKVGLGPGIILLVALTTATVILQLMFAELTLRTNQDHQLPGYSSYYLGQHIGTFTFVVDLISGYVVQLAYMIGLGAVLSALLGGSPLLWSLISMLCVGLIVYKGLDTIKHIEVVLTMFVFLIVFSLAILLSPHVSLANFNYWNVGHIGIPYGVFMFALAGYNAIPAVRRILLHREKYFPAVILLAYALVFVVYLTFMFIVLGVTGLDTTEVATIGLGNKVGPVMIVMGNILAIFTISTCYLSNGLSIRRIFQYDYKKSPFYSTLYAMTVPLLFFLIGARNFIAILGVVGGIMLGIQCSIIVLAYWKAYKHGNRKPEFTYGPLYIIGAILLLLFIAGALVTVLK